VDEFDAFGAALDHFG
jgi:hypothetical protein